MDIHIHSSPSRFVSFFGNDNVGLLNKAKSVEYKDDKAAYAIYLPLAEEGNPEAQYQCGRMLLEGRGTTRQFSSAVSFFQFAAKAGHPDAVNSLTGLESKITLLSSIVKNFNAIAPGAPALERRIALKRAVEDFILGRKQGNEIEKLTITHHDILMVFNDLAECIDDGCPDEMKAPWHDEIASLLKEGVNDYNREGTRIHTGEATLPLELWLEVGKYMSMRDNINLTGTARRHKVISDYKVISDCKVISDYKVISDEKETGFIEEQWNKFKQFLSTNDNNGCKSENDNNGCKNDQEKMWWHAKLNQDGIDYLNKSKLNPPLTAKDVFFSNPAYRKEQFIPSDELGIKYLKDHKNITDRILLQKIRDGELTLAEIEDGYQEIQTYLQTPLDKYVRYALEDPWIKARVVDGTITDESQLAKINYGKVRGINKPGVKDWLDSNPQYLQQVLNLPHDGPYDYFELFCTSLILNGLTNKMLTFEQFTSTTKSGFSALNGAKTADNCHWWLVSNPQYLSHVVSLSEVAARALGSSSWLRASVDSGIISFDWLNGITEEKMIALQDPVKQKLVEQYPSRIDEILSGALSQK
jgi:hypothetical protein